MMMNSEQEEEVWIFGRLVRRNGVSTDDINLANENNVANMTNITTQFPITTTGLHHKGETNLEDLIHTSTQWSDLKFHWGIGCSIFVLLGLVLVTLLHFRKMYLEPDRKRRRETERFAKQQARIQISDREVIRLNERPIKKDDFIDEYNRRKRKKILEQEFWALIRMEKTKKTNIDSNGLNGMDRLVKVFQTSFAVANSLYDVASKKKFLNNIYTAPLKIDSFEKKNAFEAVTAPMSQADCNMFWEMVWRENAASVVMLTERFEYSRVLSFKYWPDKLSDRWHYGNIRVTLQDTLKTADCFVRTMVLQKKHGVEKRTIKHFQIRSWNGGRQPTPAMLVDLWRRVNEEMEHRGRLCGPIILHESKQSFAKTGVYIAFHEAITRLRAKNDVNIFNYSSYMHKVYPGLTSDKESYEFIYDVVATFLNCQFAGVTVEKFEGLCKNLSSKRGWFHRDGYQKEFELLNNMAPVLTPSDCAAGYMLENRRKNRDAILLPPDKARPYLKSIQRSSGTDYINALFVDGYSESNAFIVTEWPSTKGTVNYLSTVGDFWTMVFDHDISEIVVLHNFKHKTFREPFWPTSIQWGEDYNNFRVSLLSGKRQPEYMVRNFSVMKTIDDKMYRMLGELGVKLAKKERAFNSVCKYVTMIQLLKWPKYNRKTGRLKEQQGLIQAALLAEELQTKNASKTGKERPICVVSKDGVGRCGVFCTVSNALSRIKAERKVDIFTTVNAVKTNRSVLVKNVKEYRLCHDTVMDYINAETTGIVNGGGIINVAYCNETETETEKESHV
ncbi:receptor-type tyrosine-protein phosphatase T isoform X1 [Lingula anatina]|uniref:Receptor-type tyrosine-protein phosphatase T isoform X1 n=2 Tax=Lingula anatina TaxID=7574 RepID=A0A1S3IS66_LINAN|nr:receptor-type tyrosine-protein phosphatase T isoform X1 [Lingula anatina]XP_013400913.1 receptor-type tyrosine-protein phosphatase T isoform X1 [Lingula anatina]|eukprot:XP_013400912.1 receptor-type tyrosine-protein phosphatase T isoform X1 [Lingula anatina]